MINTARLMLQVPINSDLRDRAMEVAKEQGFSSLQDIVRLFVTKLANREISLHFGGPQSELASLEAIARYEQMYNDVKSGKVKTIDFDNAEDAIGYLDTV